MAINLGSKKKGGSPLYRHFMIVLVFVLVLIGCDDGSSKTLHFKSESIHWQADYVQKSTESWTKDKSGKLNYGNTASFKLNLKYKGSDLSNIGLVKYSYEAGISSGYGETSVNKSGYLNSGSSSGRNAALLQSDDVVLVNVEWNGTKETLRLTNK